LSIILQDHTGEHDQYHSGQIEQVHGTSVVRRLQQQQRVGQSADVAEKVEDGEQNKKTGIPKTVGT